MVNQITLKTEAEAEAVYKQLQGGADFGALAAEKSTDWTRSSRGVLGELTQNDPRFPEASRAAYDLPLNRVSRPFANKEGFSLVKVTNRIPGRQLTYDEAKQGIEQNMVQMQEQNLFEKMIEGLKAKYPVTIDEVLLKKAGNQQPPTENKK
jgi:foldase protein PrsA